MLRRALVVGIGSIGRRHLANLRRQEPGMFIAVWHQHSQPGDAPSGSAGADCDVYDLAAALETRPEVAIVAGPASTHVSTALALVGSGAHVLIEKPLSNTLAGVDELIEQCRSRKRCLLVGYSLRFSDSLRRVKRAVDDGAVGRVLSIRAEIGQYLPDWRPGTDYRKGVSARAELGGGALFELSHEIDYVRWLCGEVSEVSARVGRVSGLQIDVEDVAEVVLTFANGAIGNIHLDMVQRAPTRTCRVIGSEGTLTWDGISHQVAIYSSTTRTWAELMPAETRDRNDMYVAELRHFLDCVEGTETPLIDGTAGQRVLQIALAAKTSSAEGRAVAV